MIDRQTIERINAAANIVEVVGDFVSLKRAGASFKACCPFHNERTPSFVVTPSRGIFKCFGCGKGGDAVRFVMEHEKMSYVEALKYIAKKYGIEVKEREESEEEKQQNNDAESMMILNGWATEYFTKQIHETDEGRSVGLGYLRQRGFTEATIKKFALGYCARKGNDMSAEAISEGYKEQYLVDTGLSIKRESGGYFDRFHGRVIFPIQSISGRTIGFGGRALEKSERTAKYVNSPESIVYNKSKTLYGISYAKNAIVKENYCILVEGYTDVIQMHQTGIENVVASSGTALTSEQIRLIKRFTSNITVIYDGDAAGIKASIRGVDMILSEGMNVRIVLLPEGDDPDSFAKNHSSEEVKRYIAANEEDFIGFKTKLLLEDAGNDPIKRAELMRDIVSSIAVMPDAIQRTMFIRSAAGMMDVDVSVLTSEVARRRVTAQYDQQTTEFVRSMQRQAESALSPTKKVKGGSSIEVLEREIIGMLMEYGDRDFELKEGERMVTFNFAQTLFEEFEKDKISFKNEQCKTIYDLYKVEYDQNGRGNRVEPALFINHPKVGDEAVAILTTNENYTLSTIFAERDPIIPAEQRLSEIVPRQVLLYKSKTIETIIGELNEQLKSDSLTDEQTDELLGKINALNAVRRYTSLRLGRVIL